MDSNSNVKKTENGFFKVKRKRDIRNDILELLGTNIYGLNVSQIAEQLELSRNTVKSYLGQFEREELISVKKLGRAKICFLKKPSKKRDIELLKGLLPKFFKDFLTALNRKGTESISDLPDFMKQIGSEMAPLTVWPTGSLLTPSIKNGEAFSIDTLTEIALQYFDILNTVGKVIHIELEPPSSTKNLSKIVLKIKDLSGLEFNELYYYIWAGILETKLREVYGDTIYLEIRESHPEISSYFFELGINE